MGINYLASDRSDIQFCAKQMARGLSRPTTVHWEAANRCGRFILRYPRTVQVYRMQEVCRKFTVKVDSGHDGCLLTRRYSTGLAAFRGPLPADRQHDTIGRCAQQRQV